MGGEGVRDLGPTSKTIPGPGFGLPHGIPPGNDATENPEEALQVIPGQKGLTETPGQE